ncbi:MAG: tRNA pseudouridine(38-40) synthase TruA [Verrucomicrobia bacterium]|jgi:tRNA pseudouridine38-40 synthase|nr:tRNA pseudouridine(38-40) synthase TruA [Verrucomicrobiota bacterium]
MKRFKITVGFDGTHYCGWQVQPSDVTVQGRLEAVLFRLNGERVKVHGSGRTDQGVHARGQVAHFDLEKPFTTVALMRAMNALLPEDVRIMRVEEAHASFHSRKLAKDKEYRYFIWNSATMPPTDRLHCLHVPQHLDIEAMRQAAAVLEGLHDFAAFTSVPRGGFKGSTIRLLHELKVRKDGKRIVIVARGEGFLYRMVRCLTGWLLRVGKGEVDASETESVLESCIRTARVPTAPPQGLFLWNVRYR